MYIYECDLIIVYSHIVRRIFVYPKNSEVVWKERERLSMKNIAGLFGWDCEPLTRILCHHGKRSCQRSREAVT